MGLPMAQERIAEAARARQEQLGDGEVGILVQTLGQVPDYAVFVPMCVNDKGTYIYFVAGDDYHDYDVKLGDAVKLQMYKNDRGQFCAAKIIGLATEYYMQKV